ALLFVATVMTDVVRVAALAVSWGGPPARMLQAAAIAALVIPALIIGYRTARGPFRVVRVRVPINGLPEELDGLRIVQVSDIHIGPTLDGAFLERMVAEVNALSPDVIAVTGDLVDGPVSKLRDEMTALSRLRAAH